MEEMGEDDLPCVGSDVGIVEAFEDTSAPICSAGRLPIDHREIDERTVFGRRESLNSTPPKTHSGLNYERKARETCA